MDINPEEIHYEEDYVSSKMNNDTLGFDNSEENGDHQKHSTTDAGRDIIIEEIDLDQEERECDQQYNHSY